MSSTVSPCLRYADAPKMIDWLCDTFGFTRHLVVPNESGGIAHAQLTLGSGMIMLGSVGDGDYDRALGTPAGGSQSPYVVVPDADAVYAKAKAAGASIVLEIADQDHGGRLFSFRDPEGYLWNVGTYDPWADQG